jgi:phosphate transport system substrate-binding protein
MMAPPVRVYDWSVQPTSSRRALLFLLAATAVAGACERSGQDRPPAQLKGTGATFPAPLYARWIREYASVAPQVKIDYVPAGSTRGIAAFLEESVHFAGSDAALGDAEMGAAAGAMHIPTTVGAVAVVANVPDGPDDLRMSSETVAAIFLGEVTSWNDGRIAAENPGAKLPDLPIKPVVRGDGSGTTKVLTTYLSGRVPAFKDKIGAGAQVKWVTGAVANRNDGVAEAVKKLPGSIGYTELAFARAYQLRAVALRNKAGKFVAPTLDSMTAAAADAAANAPEDLRIVLAEPDGAEAYPLTSLTFILVDERQRDPTEGAALARFLWWCVHEGQAYAPAMHYATLPPELVRRVEQKLRSMQSGGTQLLAGK